MEPTQKPPMQADTTERPWGFFRTFTRNEHDLSTVKILHVKAGESFSLQYHTYRQEFWRVLTGLPVIAIDGKKYSAKSGDEFTIPQKVSHRITAGDQDAEILEISLGQFDEGDIVRLEDKYGRI